MSVQLYKLLSGTLIAVVTALIISISVPAQAFFIAATTQTEEEQAAKPASGKAEFQWDKAYLDLENKLFEAGVDLNDYRHIGLSGSIIKDTKARNEILTGFTKYVAQNSWRSESSWAQYYVAILTDEKVRQDVERRADTIGNG
ncbi:MAG: hypothetical protein PHT33_13235 [bacterium]|nr:hypothetical protein [bacterium]